MADKKNIIIGAIALVILIGVGYKIFSPSRESQRQAIERALAYDDGIVDKRVQEAGFWGILLGDDAARRRYVARLRQVPLNGCPSEFSKAYKANVAAWEANDNAAISRTWDQVIFIAYDYGVAEK